MFASRGSAIVFKECSLYNSIRNISNKLPIISCRRKEFNYCGETYGKKEDIPIASKAWGHRKAKGDYFVVKPDIQIMKSDKPEGPGFESCIVSDEIVKALSERNIVTPTKVQRQAIAEILSGKNTLIAAETGCGKTLAYLLPLLQQISQWKLYEQSTAFNSPYAIIITPSRELTSQIYGIANFLSERLSIKTQCVTGGHTKRLIVNPKIEECDLLVASFGALSKLITTGIYKTDRTHHIVLDEADTLLDDSFNDKLIHMLRGFPFQHKLTLPPKGCQLTMASATMPNELPAELSDFIDVESIKRITSQNLHRLLPHLPQRFLRIGKSQKPLELLKIIKTDVNRGISTMIFSNKTETCNWISIFLNENGIKCLHFNKKMPVEYKLGQFKKYKSGEYNAISCTDIGSRGLDTTMTKHVLNYDFPKYTIDYIHRCGRTGRLGSSKNCYVTNFIATESDIKLTQKIELSIRQNEDLPNVENNIKKIILEKMEHVYQTNRNKSRFRAISN